MTTDPVLAQIAEIRAQRDLAMLQLQPFELAPDNDPVPVQDNPGPDLPTIPPLPEAARIDPDLGTGAGWFLDLYVPYGLAVSPMTPVLFHESAALWLASVAIARRLKVSMPFGEIHANLYCLWLAPTTLFRKTTALDIARNLARRSFPHLIAPQDTTPEALLSDLSGAQPVNYLDMSGLDQALWQAEKNFCAQRGVEYDEMSGLLAQAGKDYNGGLLEAFLRFYDCDPRFVRSTRGQGRIVVSNSYLSILGASTPAAMAQHLASERLWSNGWWPRFALLTPDSDRPDWQQATETKEPTDLIEKLCDLYAKLPIPTWPNPPEARTVALGAGVFDAWERYNRALSYDLLTPDLDARLFGSYGRLPVQVLKVSLILSALDWTSGNAPVIELPHLARAMTICEQWRASAHRAIEMTTQNEFDRTQARILRQLGRFEPDGATLRDLRRMMGDKTPDEIAEVLRQLVDTGEIAEVGTAPGAKGGRKTTRYKLSR